MGKKNFYAVKSGRKTGIFKAWAECNENIKGFSGAVFKGFETLAEAEAYLKGGSAPGAAAVNSGDVPEKDCLVAYVDGSFNKKESIYSYGVVIIKPDENILEFSGIGQNAEAASEWNIAGELLGAMSAVKWASDNGYSGILIKHDYEGIARWANGEWQAKKYCSQNYVKFLSKYKGKITVDFEKVPAHSGVKYNEAADRLAKQAIEDHLNESAGE